MKAEPAVRSERCPGSDHYVGVHEVKVGPDSAVCPTCARHTSFHRITGRLARHNRLVAPPS